MKIRLFIIGIIGLFYVSCAQTKALDFNESDLLKRVEKLSSDEFEGRRTGEKGNDLARAYIIDQFKKLKLQGYSGTFEHPFSFSRQQVAYNANNILVEIKGTKYPETYIVISAHYDHLGIINDQIYNGADDDASGVSALIAYAEYFKKNPPKHSVILAAFDAEELGLQGAKHFVETFDNEKILVNINLDMISRSKNNELYVVGGRYNEGLKSLLANLENPTSTKLLQGHDGTDGKQDWTMSSDHGPFYKAGIPFLYFGNEDHAAYHKPTDDFDDITPRFYKNSVQIIFAVIQAIDSKGL